MAHQQLAHQNRAHRLEHIAQHHHDGQLAAERPVKVGKSRIAAAVVTHIIMKDILANQSARR